MYTSAVIFIHIDMYTRTYVSAQEWRNRTLADHERFDV